MQENIEVQKPESKIKVTSKDLILALRAKFPKAAVLTEVTMDDEEEAHRIRTALTIMKPYYKKYFDKKGETYEAVLPEGFNVKTAVPYRRIDALVFDKQQRTAVEVKSRSDFFRDTELKRSAWLKHTHRFVYLTPKGLVKPEEVAEGCGLWEYEDGQITVVRRAKINKEAADFPAAMVKYFAWRAFAAERKLEKLKK